MLRGERSALSRLNCAMLSVTNALLSAGAFDRAAFRFSCAPRQRCYARAAAVRACCESLL
jgi:hypothetical protein